MGAHLDRKEGVSLNFVTITGTFDDGSGNPVSGEVVFTPSVTVYAAGVPVVYPDVPVTVPISGGNLGTVHLLATDNGGLTIEGLTGFFYWSVTVTISGVSQGWSFFLPSSPSTVDLFSLANTPGGGGMLNPMTTLGDMIDGGSAGAPQRLAGNTTATSEFLNSTGTGSAANTPTWKAILAADLASVTEFAPAGLTGATSASRYVGATTSGAPGSGTFAVGDFVIDQTGKVWVCTTAGTPGTWTQVGGGGLPVSGGTMTGALNPAVVTLTDASTVSVHAAAGTDFRLTTTSGVGASRTMRAPSSPVDGQVIKFQVAQAASGGPYTVSWNAVYDFGTAGTPTLSSSASKVDIIGFAYNASLVKWCALGSALGF